MISVSVEDTILRRRAASQRWKANNREYYLKQKRELSARPEYRARMRQKYAEKQQELKDAGILPRKMGRPRLYSGEEWVEVERARAREASSRYRLKKRLSRVSKNNESTTSEDPNSESDRCSDCSGHAAQSASIRIGSGPAHKWTVSHDF